MSVPASPEQDPEKIAPGAFVMWHQRHAFGTVENWVEDEQSWSVRADDGNLYTASKDMIFRVPFKPSSRVELVGENVGEMGGLCGEILDYLPERNRWAVKLDIGAEAATRPEDLRATDKSKPEPGECSCSGSDPNAQDASKNCTDNLREQVPELAGLDAADQALVKLVAKEGAGEKDWESKAVTLSSSTEHKEDRSGSELKKRWVEIAPILQKHLATDPTMPCSHKCSSCPTRSNCHLHEELDSKQLEW